MGRAPPERTAVGVVRRQAGAIARSVANGPHDSGTVSDINGMEKDERPQRLRRFVPPPRKKGIITLERGDECQFRIVENGQYFIFEVREDCWIAFRIVLSSR
jgi:hypothetical protein